MKMGVARLCCPLCREYCRALHRR